MIEAIMFFALGFLAASLVALVLLSAVWHRAVRLTTRRIEGAIPVSMAEIQADKDQLRAEFAMSTRRLETSVEQLKRKTVEQITEIRRKSDTLHLLKVEIEEKAATITALEAHERTLRDNLRGTEEELSLKSRALHASEAELAAKTSELAQLARSLADKTSEADSRRVEIVALETQRETLKGRIVDLEREVAATEARLVEDRGQADKTSRNLSEERGKAESLARRLAEMESRLAESTAEAESLARTVAGLEAEAHRQTELAAQREVELTALIAERDQAIVIARAEIEKNRAEALAVHREIDTATRSFSTTIENLKSDKTMLEDAVAQMRDDRERLQADVASLKNEAESAWSNERVENALLRERINDVAAEVARLTANLEGSGSPIERILSEVPASASAQRQNGGPGRSGSAAADPSAAEPRPSLAERIRALQARPSRR
jgi:chromosome segregation ATPase